MPTMPSASAPPPGWRVVEPYAVFLTIVLIGAVGFVVSGLVAEDQLTLPRLASDVWPSAARQVD